MADRLLFRWIVLPALVLGTLMMTASLLFAAPPRAPSSDVVISQVYGGGGNTGAPFQNDFIELFNRGAAPVTLTNWTVQYASAAGSTWKATVLSGTVAPGRYYLIQEDSSGSTGATLPAADASGTIPMSATAGKVALVMTTTLLSEPCPLSTTTAVIVDFVGYGTLGSHVNCYETAAAPAPNNTTADLRVNDGCTDTDDNSNDFAKGAPYPRNSSSPFNPCLPLPTPTPVPPAEKLFITEVLYDGTQVNEGDEFIELANPLTHTLDLGGYKIGDEETKGAGEGMYIFPAGTNLAPNAVLVVAKNAEQFRARFGFDPAFELGTSGSGLTDTPSVPNLAKYTVWATGSLALSNTGDEVLLLGPSDERVDAVAWGKGDFAATGLAGDASASAPLSLQRYGTQDTNNMTFDFLSVAPAPGALVTPPTQTAPVPGATMPGGMHAYWGDLHAHSTVSDGSGPPRMAYATARAAGLHFFALTDHDSWLTQDEWDEIGDAARAATVDHAFVALRAFEFTSPDGHVTAFNTNTWVSHTDPNLDSLPKLYAWLGSQSNAFVQFNHPVWDRGGDFNNMAFNPTGANVMALQEVGNNAHTAYDSFESMYVTALNRDWQVAPTNNSDNHALTWGSDSPHRVGVIAPALTPANVIDALRARRVFATEDANLAIALQANGAWMGSTIRTEQSINFTVTVSDPDDEAWWLDLYDNGKVVLSQQYTNAATWTDKVKGNSSHYYFARVTQIDGDRAYSAPIWTDSTSINSTKRWDLGRVTVAKARIALLDAMVELDACVTAEPGIFGDRYMYIQDPSTGIKIYLRSQNGDFPPLHANDRVVLRGRTRLIDGERLVEIEDTKTIDVRGVCEPVMPIQRKTSRINSYSEGLLVEIAGVVKRIGQGEFVVNDQGRFGDNRGDALVFINPTTGIQFPQLAVGQSVRVIGLVGRAHSAIVIMPRFAADSVIASPPGATSTRVPTAAQRAVSTRTPTAALRAAPPIATPTRAPVTPSPTPRAFMRPTPAPAPAASPINARALAAVGGSTSIAVSFVMFAIAAALLSKKR